MSEIFSFIGFVITVIFFAWFGSTLSSINSKLGVIAKCAQDTSPLRPADGVKTRICGRCSATVDASAKMCGYCGARSM